MSVIGYKVFNPDWTCRGFQYEVGKTFILTGDLQICKHGFHFCKKLSDCFNYYRFDPENKVAVIEASGAIVETNDKCATDVISVIREMSWYEVLDLVNTGKACTGHNNSGSFNSGSFNSGHYNSGNFNSGDRNSGNFNSGSSNSGFHNSGNFNSGSFNSGNCNSGSFNSTDYSSGFFNTVEQPVMVFNKPTNMTRLEFRRLPAFSLLYYNLNLIEWIPLCLMTDEEKQHHPDCDALGGYYRVNEYKTAFRNMWNTFTDEEKMTVRDLPNFDADVFKEITGIDVNNE